MALTQKNCLSGLAILLVGLIGLTGCSSMLYQPTRRLYVNPKALPYVPEEIHFKDPNGTELVAWYFRQPKPEMAKARLLFFHGNGQNMSSHFVALFWLMKQGYEFLIFDYPGYGISQGDPTPENTVLAGLTAARWLKNQKPEKPMAFFGQSLGGAVAMTTALEFKKEQPLCLLAVDSTFNSYRAAAKDILAKYWFTWILQPMAYVVLSDKFAPRDRVKELSPIPLIVSHGVNDPMISHKRGEEVFRLANEPKEFWSIEKGQHGDIFNGSNREIYRSRFVQSLEKHCGPQP